jgi:5-methylcytosine-specific restriction endonuclease McrA
MARWRAAYRAKNLAKRRAYSSKYAKEHPREMYAHTITRRARRKTRIRGVHIPARELQKVLSDSLGLCVYCNERRPLQIDHIEPLTGGGLHEIDNLTAACKTCNCRKNARPLLIWLAYRANENARLVEAA